MGAGGLLSPRPDLRPGEGDGARVGRHGQQRGAVSGGPPGFTVSQGAWEQDASVLV